MNHKIFISYKYSDNNVESLFTSRETSARDYVDRLQQLLGAVHINKGEKNNESLASLSWLSGALGAAGWLCGGE